MEFLPPFQSLVSVSRPYSTASDVSKLLQVLLQERGKMNSVPLLAIAVGWHFSGTTSVTDITEGFGFHPLERQPSFAQAACPTSGGDWYADFKPVGNALVKDHERNLRISGWSTQEISLFNEGLGN